MIPQEKRINNKKDYKDWIKYELSNYSMKVAFINRLFRLSENAILAKHQILLRKCEYYKNSGRKILFLICNIRLRKYQNKYSLHIPLNCCQRGLKIMHLGPILINGNASLGENVKIHMNVGIVAGGTNNDTPTIGNNVVIGYGAVILGNCHVADGIAIGLMQL